MSEIKIGDKVVRTGYSNGILENGSVYTVKQFDTYHVVLEGIDGTFFKTLFEVVEETLPPAFTISQTVSGTIIDIHGVAEIGVLKRLSMVQCEAIVNIINGDN